MAESEKIDNNDDVVSEALKFLEGTAPFIMEQGMNPHVYSNDTYNPVPYGLLDMFYRMVFTNRVGMMVGKDAVTGELATLLCFVGDKGEDDVELFPVAVLLQAEETQRYLAPLGNGEYYDPDTETSE